MCIHKFYVKTWFFNLGSSTDFNPTSEVCTFETDMDYDINFSKIEFSISFDLAEYTYSSPLEYIFFL